MCDDLTVKVGNSRFMARAARLPWFYFLREKHKERIINYEVFSRDGICSIGSRAVESGIKQIARRIKIFGASWTSDHVGQVLAHRCAYLNGLMGNQRKLA